MLGPEQLAVVGYGEYSKHNYDLGVQEDVLIPQFAHSLQSECRDDGTNTVVAVVNAPAKGTLRILMRQYAAGGHVRTAAGAPPEGTPLD